MKTLTTHSKLCELCRHGYDSFLIENINPFCRYKSCHNGKTCSQFKEYKETEDLTYGEKIRN